MRGLDYLGKDTRWGLAQLSGRRSKKVFLKESSLLTETK